MTGAPTAAQSSLTTRTALADFCLDAQTADIDPVAWQRGRDAITDWVGVAIAGSKEPVAGHVLRFLETLGALRADTGSILIGETRVADPCSAALYNGTLAHALDYDDIAHPSKAHISASVIAALISSVPADQIGADPFRTAYIVGYEVAATVGNVLLRRRRSPGWHQTGVLGPFGAAAAVSKIWGLGREQTAQALGIAASCSSGLHINLGSMTKPLHAGRAAQAGVMAALLAGDGMTSSADVFDAPMGFFRTYSTSPADELEEATRQAVARLGDPWELSTEVGIALKPYPCCAATHCAIEAALELGVGIDPAEIESVYVGMSQTASDPLVHHRPRTGLEAKFSMEYCVAAALLRGRIGIDTFTNSAVTSPDVRQLIEATSVAVDDRVRTSEEFAAVVRVDLRAGECRETTIDLARGKPARWFSAPEVRAKFDDCVGHAFGPEVASVLYPQLISADPVDERTMHMLLSGHLLEAGTP